MTAARIDPVGRTVLVDLPVDVDVLVALLRGITSAFPDAGIVDSGDLDVLRIDLVPPFDLEPDPELLT